MVVLCQTSRYGWRAQFDWLPCVVLLYAQLWSGEASRKLTAAVRSLRARNVCPSEEDCFGSQLIMATVHCPRYSLHWEETDCLSYYDMLSLHEVFEIVGSQLTEADVDVLSFLLDEAYPARHPLDPEGWTEDVPPDSDLPVNSPCPRLLEAWRRIRPRGEPCLSSSRHRPKSGVELLLELERRGFLLEGNMEPLLQLLRILTRHDLLPFVSSKKRRTVSPNREPENDARSAGPTHASSHTDLVSLENTQASQWRTGVGSAAAANAPCRRKRGRGRGRARRSRTTPQVVPQPPPNKVTCEPSSTPLLTQEWVEKAGEWIEREKRESARSTKSVRCPLCAIKHTVEPSVCFLTRSLLHDAWSMSKLKNRLTQVSGTKQVGHPHILREREGEL
ncbi:hypothetical protein AOLI_G00042830 [Acnodon oligacanthus]